jgi:Cu(I)/Ag(I) efflux system membrane fusion protein
MRKSIGASALMLAAAGIAGGSYRLGAGHWPMLGPSPQTTTIAGATASEAQDRKVLYWRDPDGKAVFSASLAKTEDGRSYRAVYDDQEPLLPGDKPREVKTAKNSAKKILYYRNPMGLADISLAPKKDSMGMDYLPVYEGEEEGSSVKVSLDRVQRSGVRSEAAEMRTIAQPVRAPGVAKPDERTLRAITLRADGFIEALYANETGKHVRAGEPLFRVYSPQIVSTEIDYRTAVAAPGRGQHDEAGAIQKLKNLDVPDSVIAQLRANPNPSLAIDWPSPVSGVVMEKKAVEGQMVKAGEEMLLLADLTKIWVIANVAEQDMGMIKIGAPAKISFRAFPDEPFEGHVTFVLHELDMASRTGKVRIEVENPEHRIKHEMYADVEIDTGAGAAPRLAVPTSAVIDSGSRQVVIVDRGEGRFEPRTVKLGLQGDGFVEVRDGLKAGEKVLVAANFLIDAESNLKAALKGFTADENKRSESKP